MQRYRSLVMDSARWDGFAFRDDDIIISTPSKCGTTWTQRLCSLLLSVEPSSERPMAVISPWLDMLTRPRDEVVADLEAQRHRRFIKTHTPLDGLPFLAGVTYLTVGRDPRDVAISWANHFDNMDLERFIGFREQAVGLDDLAEVMPRGMPAPPPDDPLERFWMWVEPDPPQDLGGGLRAMLYHLETFWDLRDEPNVHLFHYAQMKEDLPGQLRARAPALGVEPDDDELATMAEAATFESMRARAGDLTPNTDRVFWKDTAAFFNKGTSGQWRDLLSDTDVARYYKVAGDMASTDLLGWVHQAR